MMYGMAISGNRKVNFLGKVGRLARHEHCQLRFVVMNLKSNPSAGLCAFLQHHSAALAQWRRCRFGSYEGSDSARFMCWKDRGKLIEGIR